MRLTLRTLLAYIDNILDPQDHEELAKRVAASDVANDLLHRTRDASRRLRLPAPPLEASGPQSDANTVAEYLDNTLPPDDVTEFERRCLDLDTYPDADSFLAEAASCHHVLTMVLAQRAEIDPASKQRMYSLPLRVDQQPQSAAPAAPSAGPAPAAVTAPPITEASGVHEVPDYLRASDRPLLGRLLPAIAALLLLGVTLVFALGPNGWLTASNDEPTVTEPPEAPPESVEPPPIEPPPVAPPTEGANEPGGAAEATAPPPSEPQPPAGIPTEQAPETTPPTLPPVIPETPEVDPMVPPSEIEPPPAAPSTSLPEPTTPPVTEPAIPMPETPEPETPSEGVPSTPPMVEPEASDPMMEAPEPEVPAEPARLGISGGKDQVLLRLSPDGSTWRRLEPRSEVMPGDTLLSLPTYQPSILFENRAALDLFDGTRVDTSVMGESTPSVAITYGRMLLTNFSQGPVEVELTIGEQPGQLILQPSASLAVDVRRLFQPGVDPRDVASPLEAVCYAPLGDVRWVGPDFQVDASQRGLWRVTDLVTGRLMEYEEDPEWIGGRVLTRVEREASPRVESQLISSEPIWSQLSIISQSSRKDERALATICAVHVGQFDSTVQALRDEEQQLSWADEIEALRFAMSSSPSLAQAVYNELTRQHRKELADDLYEMLCGYSLEQVGKTPDQWRVGAMRKLINWLESDQLDFRVLANYNLEQITGRRGVFNPVGPSGARETSINRQRARLENGDLQPAGLTPSAG